MAEAPVVNILVTGFGPFRNEPLNPSYLIASTLPGELPASPACPVTIRINFYPYQIPVSYEDVRALIPRLYFAYKDSIDIVLHMGVSESGSSFALEKLAHRDGYDSQGPDIHGVKPDKRDGATYWADCPPILETSLDYDSIFQRWRTYLLESASVGPAPPVGASAPSTSASISSSSPNVLGGISLRPSHDAGHFLCDFIYYSSLAEHHRMKRGRRRGSSGGSRGSGSGRDSSIDERPVIFMHVPAWNGTDDLNKGKAVTIALLKALARSWIEGKSVEKAGPK